MISNVSFTGREGMLSKASKEVKNVANEYVGPGKIFSDEERFIAEHRQKVSKHPYVSPYCGVIEIKTTPVVQKAEEVNVDFVSETAPHRFTILG